LQATDERRRSGSHYTPRSLTQPIVAETLRPILERLGPRATHDDILALKVLDPAMGSGAFLVEACRQLADELVRAWEVHGVRPPVPPDEDALLYAKQLVAQRCLYGVDRNELAAELGKLSLWLATLARDHEFTFLDHCIRHGDSLVGLDRRQIEALHWTQQASIPVDLMQALLRSRLAEAERERERIRTALDNEPEDQQRLVLGRAERALADPKLVGDAVIAAFFSADKARAREEARQRGREQVEQAGIGWQDRLKPAVAALRGGNPPIVPFHWPLEFPEVFDRDNTGFDAIVGNPPFAGKNTTIAVNADHYLDWLQTLHPGAHGNSDIVGHFFRRAYSLLRKGGCLGLLATNTIRQGDTRATGLRPIRQAGGTIYAVRRRYRWPGEASVVVAIIHIAKGDYSGTCRLDGREVPIITAFLFHGGGDDDPRPLNTNANKSFQGSIVLGMGFIFDDHDSTGVANPTRIRSDLIVKDARNSERIFPYIGGEELNETSPQGFQHRWVINFEDFPCSRDESLPSWHECAAERRNTMVREGIVPLDYPGSVAADWPCLYGIVETKVKPIREKDNREVRRRYWWRFAERAPALYEVIRSLDRVLVVARVSSSFAFTFVPTNFIVNDKIVAFAFDNFFMFGVLQSRVHEVWARILSGTLGDTLQYTPSLCFENFPAPQSTATIEMMSQAYYEFRTSLMNEYREGLTVIYNRFHDPDERSNAIGELRRLHDAMDRAVLDAYGWTDIRPTCEFELEWEDDEAENGRRRRKPWRYRWPEPVRDEVLARLLALNAQRAEEERLALGDL
jgi:hypothetical protein